MKVAFAELMAAALRVQALAPTLQGVGPGVLAPLAKDPTSIGAAARLELASKEVWALACAQAQSLRTAGLQMFMIAVKFGTQEEVNAANLAALNVALGSIDAGTLAALPPVPPLIPDIRAPLPPPAGLTGEKFSQLVTAGSSGAAAGFTTAATTNGTGADTVALALREITATVPDLWESPEGTAALAGRLTEHAGAANAVAERWQALAEQSQKHAEVYSQAVTVLPKPMEFGQNDAAMHDAVSTNINGSNNAVISQLIRQRGELEQRALATSARYHADTEATTGPDGAAVPHSTPSGAHPATGPGAGTPAGVAAKPGEAPVPKAAGGEAASPAGQAG
ncbi:MAG: PPE domain-containing protein, partial [Mycobacterium sp.]